MYLSLELSEGAASIPVEGMLAEAAKAGFAAVELPFGSGLIAEDVAEPSCRELAKRATVNHISISSLRAPVTYARGLISSDSATRATAWGSIIAAFDRASWLSAESLILDSPRRDEKSDAADRASPDDARKLALDALLALRFEAERRAIVLACDFKVSGTIMSPRELRDLIDAVNSPWVGVTLSPVCVGAGPPLEEWIMALGHRVRHVRLADEEELDASGGPTNWDRARMALIAARFEGPLVCGGSKPPTETGRHWAKVLSLGTRF